MEFLQGFSECWWPGPSCKVIWEAWAAIGTVAGVMAAILGPMIFGHIRRRRLTILFAASFFDELWQDLQTVVKIRREYRLIPEAQQTDAWAVEGFLMVDSSGGFRREFADAGRKLQLCEQGKYLAQWQEIDSKMAVYIADAIKAARSLRDSMARPVDDLSAAAADWEGYFSALNNAAAIAEWTIHRAATECNDRVMRSTVGWRARFAEIFRAGRFELR